MSALREPPRWGTADDEVGSHWRPALRIARGEGPSAAEHERMWGALAARLPDSAGSGAEPGAPGAVATSGNAGSILVRSASSGLWRIIGTGIVAAALGYGAAKITTRASAPAGPVEVARVAASQKPAAPVEVARPRPTQPLAMPSPAAPAPEPALRVEESLDATEPPTTSAHQRASESTRSGQRAGAASLDRASNANTSRASASSANASRAKLLESAASRHQPTEEPTSGSADLAAELDLLARARRVVAGSPARALQLTAEHARRFSGGVLAQEREVLAIDALSRLGQHDLAAMRARRFIERYPDSAHRVRLDLALHGQRTEF